MQSKARADKANEAKAEEKSMSECSCMDEADEADNFQPSIKPKNKIILPPAIRSTPIGDKHIYYTNEIGEQKVAHIDGSDIYIDDEHISEHRINNIFYEALHESVKNGNKVKINGVPVDYETFEVSNDKFHKNVFKDEDMKSYIYIPPRCVIS